MTTNDVLSLDCLGQRFASGVLFNAAAVEDAAARLPIFGIAQVATEALLAVQFHIANFDTIRTNCRESVYWPDFVRLVAAGQVPPNWLPGALGRCVIGWAKEVA